MKQEERTLHHTIWRARVQMYLAKYKLHATYWITHLHSHALDENSTNLKITRFFPSLLRFLQTLVYPTGSSAISETDPPGYYNTDDTTQQPITTPPIETTQQNEVAVADLDTCLLYTSPSPRD